MTIKEMHEALDIAIHFDGIEVVRKRLAGVSPAGSPPEPGCLSRGAASQATHTLSPQSCRCPTKLEVAVQHAVMHLKSEARDATGYARHMRKEGFEGEAIDAENWAGKFTLYADYLERRLPEAQSDRSEVEEAGCPDTQDGWFQCSFAGKPVRSRCADCPAGGNGMERSGSDNSQARLSGTD